MSDLTPEDREALADLIHPHMRGVRDRHDYLVGPAAQEAADDVAELVARIRDEAVAAAVTEVRKDNADLARQLSQASARLADAYDEGYDAAYAWAHHIVNRLGYLERGRDDNGNPYRAVLPDRADRKAADQ